MARTRRIRPEEVFGADRFPLAVHRQPHHAVTPVHGHGFDELVVILGGQAAHQVGSQTYDVQAGDVFVLLGQTRHAYPRTRNLSLVNILYDWRRLGLMQADLPTLPGYHALFQIEPRMRGRAHFRNRLRLEAEELGRLAGLIAELEAELSGRGPGRRFAAITAFMRIVLLLSRAYSQAPVAATRPVWQISEVLGFMERNYGNRLTIGQLAKVAHMSQTSLFRAFRRVLDKSPIEHLIGLRIDKARSLLARADLPITQVALAVGFSDGNYFTRQFVRVMNTSPRQYRRRLLGKATAADRGQPGRKKEAPAPDSRRL